MKNRAFTILEILVDLAVIGVFSAITYPNITSWITDRAVKEQTYKFVSEIKEMKSKVTSSEYALAMIRFTGGGDFEYASMNKYFMTADDYNHNYSGSNYVGGNNLYTCDYSTSNQRYQSPTTFTSQEVRHWPNIHMCISKDGTKKGVLNQTNPATGVTRSLGLVIFCSPTNTTKGGGSNRCNDTNKNDYRYMVTWDVFTNLKVYKYNKGKDQWCAGSVCYSLSEFN